MKKFVLMLAAFVLAFAFTACVDDSSSIPEGELTVTANSREGFDASLAMDGDISTGWIGVRKANETVPQIVTIDLGKETEFSTVTINDGFAAGFTNKKPDYVDVKFTDPGPQKRNVSGMQDGTSVVNLLSGNTMSWKSVEMPTEASPQWFYFSFRAAQSVSKLVFDNAYNNSVLESFAVYYTDEALEKNDIADKSNYTLLEKVENNEEYVCELELEESVSLQGIYVEIYSQVSEGDPVVASLDELLFYAPAGDDYTEPHQPVKFHLMGSNDGEKFETFAEENGNYNEVWTRTLDAPVKYRYIKYLLFEENNNNYPSIGEITFS